MGTELDPLIHRVGQTNRSPVVEDEEDNDNKKDNKNYFLFVFFAAEYSIRTCISIILQTIAVIEFIKYNVSYRFTLG